MRSANPNAHGGDKNALVTEQLEIPAFYHPDIDECKQQDEQLSPVPEPWMTVQPEVVKWVTAVLQYRHRMTDGTVKENGDGGRSDRDEDKSDGDDDQLDGDGRESDWEMQYTQALEAKEGDKRARVELMALRPGKGWKAGMLMSDRLYLEFVRTLSNADPEQYLKTLQSVEPALYSVIFAQLLRHGRYHLFWARVDLRAADRPGNVISRLVPALFRVKSTVQTQPVKLTDCQRCLPLSQVALLIDKQHSDGAHQRHIHRTLTEVYLGVPRKAIELFNRRCQVCGVGKWKRNLPPPRTIVVQHVRQRYTIDLFDMKHWQQRSTGEGVGMRFVAHLIDSASNLRWAYPIAGNTLDEEVKEVVRRVFEDFGHPAVLHTDNGLEVRNLQLEELCRVWGTRIVRGPRGRPQSQGVVERYNEVLQRAMDNYKDSHPEVTDWTFVLRHVIPDLNKQVCSVTNCRPSIYFHQHDQYSRQLRPIPEGQDVVIPMLEVDMIPPLDWAPPPELKDDEEKHLDDDGKAMNVVERSERARSRPGASVALPTTSLSNPSAPAPAPALPPPTTPL